MYTMKNRVTFKALRSKKKKLKINQTLIQALMKNGENHQGKPGIWPMKMILAPVIFPVSTYNLYMVYI